MGMGRVGHLEQQLDVAAKLGFIGAGPFVLFFAAEECHKGRGGADLVFGADLVCVVQIDFYQNSFLACFCCEFVIGWVDNLARWAGCGREEDYSTYVLGGGQEFF